MSRSLNLTRRQRKIQDFAPFHGFGLVERQTRAASKMAAPMATTARTAAAENMCAGARLKQPLQLNTSLPVTQNATPATGRGSGDHGTPRMGNTGETGSAPPPPPQLSVEVLAELRAMRADITARSDALSIKMDHICARLDAMDGRHKELDMRVTLIDEILAPLPPRIQLLENAMKQVQDKLNDAESRSRRNNVCFVGIREGAEEGDTATFIEDLVQKWFPNAPFTQHLAVVRAHRALQPRPVPGAALRTILARFLHFKDRDTVLREARIYGLLRYEGSNVYVFPDITLQDQQARKKSDAVKRLLRDRGHRYSMLHPAKLRFELNNRVHFYTDAEAAYTFVEAQTSAQDFDAPSNAE